MPVKYYSEEEMRISEDKLRVYADIIRNVMYNVQCNFSPEEPNKDTWEYIPNSYLNDMMESIKYVKGALKNIYSPKFIELGCGIGIYTAMAYKMGCDSIGVDFNKKLIDTAKLIFTTKSNKQIRFIKGDVLKQSKNIKESDLVYFYSPFKKEKSAEFMEFVVKNMRKGSYCIMATHCDEENKTINKLKKNKIIKNIKEHYNLYIKL
jgi:SAM-dependent methyltransferase